MSSNHFSSTHKEGHFAVSALVSSSGKGIIKKHVVCLGNKIKLRLFSAIPYPIVVSIITELHFERK